jgi:hemolysin III
MNAAQSSADNNLRTSFSPSGSSRRPTVAAHRQSLDFAQRISFGNWGERMADFPLANLREPASTLTHALWFVAAIPLIVRLLNRTSDRAKQASIIIYGLTVLACAGASTAFHAVQGDDATIIWYNRLDHIGIGLLIAGTYTPIACHLLEAKSGTRILAMIWLAAGAAALLRLAIHPIPKGIAVGIYLLMGWGAAPGYAMLWRRLEWRQARMIAEGGFFYTIGALVHWQNMPNPWPGVFEAHDTFHVLVMLGSFRHYQFMDQVVVPTFDAESLGARGRFAVTAPVEDLPAPSSAVPRPYLWRIVTRKQPARRD